MGDLTYSPSIDVACGGVLRGRDAMRGGDDGRERGEASCMRGCEAFRSGDFPFAGRYTSGPGNGFSARSSGKRLKSRSAVHSASAPWLRQRAAIRAS